MLSKRIIPVLLLRNTSLVKTKQFREFVYVGDPLNTVRIFNELEVDELILNDIFLKYYSGDRKFMNRLGMEDKKKLQQRIRILSVSKF